MEHEARRVRRSSAETLLPCAVYSSRLFCPRSFLRIVDLFSLRARTNLWGIRILKLPLPDS